MEIHFFHLMPWPYLPADFDDHERYPSTWVTLSNSLYDPRQGHKLYNRYLDEMEYAEELGFDGVCVNEHHQNAYGLMPAPNIMAAAIARRTRRAKILILGNGLPLRDHPLRVAEEVAMLDVMSGGRIVSGFVRGIGAEYYSMGINPTYSRERFHEAHDLIIRAWTEPGPFDFEGKHYRVRYVNVWPRPLQKPHPPIWIPGSGSLETINWCAHPDRRYPFLAVYMPTTQVASLFDLYRQSARNFGYQAAPDQLGHLLPIYVSDSDEQAREEAAQHVVWLYKNGLRFVREMFFPPGYVSAQSLSRMFSSGRATDYAGFSFDDLNRLGYCFVGGVETVRRRLLDAFREMGHGLLMALLQIGDMPRDRTRRNMELFAREVMPALRAEFGNRRVN
jgi:alkanesulfonate monooxygenase SsuD/methylene tetrahydromethanopterin reductase-like flavin-dependent oxidoreductase (luciferase family)